MKKLKFGILSIILVLIISISGISFATNDTSSDLQVNANNNTNQTSLASDLYLTDDTIELTQNVEGNAFLFGKEVTVSSQIDGNLVIMADTVNITDDAYIDASVFVLAKTIQFDTLSSHLYAVCNELNISSDHGVYKDLYVLAKKVSMHGTVGRDAYIYADELSLSGNNSAGVIKGDLTYSLPEDIEFPEGSIVGEKNYSKKAEMKTALDFHEILLHFVNAIFAASLIYLILKFFLAKGLQKSSSCLATKFGKVFLTGLISLIVIPIVSVLLLFSKVGFVLGVILLAIYMLMLAIAPYFLSAILGRRMANNKTQTKVIVEYLITIAIALVISAVSIIPYIGLIVGLFISILGLGVIIYNIFFDSNKKGISQG